MQKIEKESSFGKPQFLFYHKEHIMYTLCTRNKDTFI